MEHDDISYIYPIALKGEEIQWDLMAQDGIISQEEADLFKAADALPSALVNVFTRELSGVRRLTFTRWMSSVGHALGDRPSIAASSGRSPANRVAGHGSVARGTRIALYPRQE